MAVTEVKAIQRQVGAQQGTNSTIYRVVYRVKVNDTDDGVNQVLNAVGVPQPGSTYAYGNDLDLNTTLLSRFPFRDPSIPGIWYVNVEWLKELSPDDPNFNYEGFPRIVPGHRVITEPLKKTKFVNFVDANGDALDPQPANDKINPDDILTPCNSVGIPIKPAIEKRNVIPTFTVQWYRRQWVNNYSDVIGKVNDDTYTLTWIDPTGLIIFIRTFQARELLCVDASSAGVRTFQNQAWQLISMEFWFKDGGWFNDELDRGFDVRVVAGDPDGHGGTISASQLLAGAPKIRRLIDNNGRDVREPMLLNGAGQLLAPPDPDNAVYLRFTLGVGDEYDYDTLNVGA